MIDPKPKTVFLPVFNLRLAGYLMQQGFPLLDLRENERYPGRKVFYFVDGESIKREVQSYLNAR